MTEPKPSILDQFPERPRDDDIVDATAHVHAARDAALANPRIAAAVEEKTEKLRKRVVALAVLRKDR